MVTVACTNWDMACRSPEAFAVGCQPIEKDGNTFVSHRWDENYRALTQKSEASDQSSSVAITIGSRSSGVPKK